MDLHALSAGAVPRKNGYGHYAKSIGGRSPSLKWPHLYDILQAKGYSKEKAARISNSRIGMRKKGKLRGLSYKNAGNPRALKNVLKTYERKHSRPKAMAASLIAACHSASCAPPPAGTGGSDDGGGRSRGLITKSRDRGGSPGARKAIVKAIARTKDTPIPPHVGQAGQAGHVPVAKYGMTFDPKSAEIVSTVRMQDQRDLIDWSKAERRTIPASDIGTLHANEASVKASTVERVASGKTPLREGYVVKLHETGDGQLHIVDGHHRVAMAAAAGRPLDVQIHRNQKFTNGAEADPFTAEDGTIDRAKLRETITHLSKATPEELLFAAHHKGMVNAEAVHARGRETNTKIGAMLGKGPLRGMGTALMLGSKRWKPVKPEDLNRDWGNG